MEPTPGEYPSKMRVALVRRNPADGAAPLGLKKSVASPPALSLHASLSHPPVSLPPVAASTRRPVRGPHAAGHERGPARDRTAGADARSSRGQGSGPTAPTARQERTAPGRAGRGQAPTARQDQAAGSAWEPVSWPQAAPVPAFLSLHRSLHCSR